MPPLLESSSSSFKDCSIVSLVPSPTTPLEVVLVHRNGVVTRPKSQATYQISGDSVQAACARPFSTSLSFLAILLPHALVLLDEKDEHITQERHIPLSSHRKYHGLCWDATGRSVFVYSHESCYVDVIDAAKGKWVYSQRVLGFRHQVKCFSASADTYFVYGYNALTFRILNGKDFSTKALFESKFPLVCNTDLFSTSNSLLVGNVHEGISLVENGDKQEVVVSSQVLKALNPHNDLVRLDWDYARKHILVWFANGQVAQFEMKKILQHKWVADFVSWKYTSPPAYCQFVQNALYVQSVVGEPVVREHLE